MNIGVSGKSWGWIGAFVVAFAVIAFVAVGAMPQSAGAKWKQPGCGKFKKQVKQAGKKVRKAKGAARKTARQQLVTARRKQKQCANDRLVYNQVKNSRFVGGAMGDGSPVDDVFCANGNWQSDSTVMKTGWKVTDSRVKNPKNFVAGISALIKVTRVKGRPTQIAYHRIGVVRKGNNWEVGWMSFDQLMGSGPATKTDARSLCAAM